LKNDAQDECALVGVSAGLEIGSAFAGVEASAWLSSIV
jgi:hypothetical protein